MKNFLVLIIIVLSQFCLTAQSFHDPYEVKGEVATIYFKNHLDKTNAGYPGWTGVSYYKDGRITKLIGLWRGQVRHKEKYRYKTEDGITVTTKKSSAEGKWVYRRTKKVDDRTISMVRQEINNRPETKDSISDIIYDDLGTAVAYRTEYVDLPGDFHVANFTVEYGSDTIKNKSYRKEELSWQNIYVLDSLGNPVLNYIITYLRDELGVRQPEKKSFSRYEFDERGNWIRMYELDGSGQEQLFFTRRIEYTDGWIGNQAHSDEQ